MPESLRATALRGAARCIFGSPACLQWCGSRAGVPSAPSHRDKYPGYVVSGGGHDFSNSGIIHKKIIDFLLSPEL
ncbi:MAG TPA: hypothetical protein IAB69_00645 [Candidatus Coproplasma excrementigallinarum]|uniref:Uncharacterized protein n=1 Tax=Candidatus Coproplasma excrementigallinarum TaxID=2840747 RepID=A0A9D1SHZ5_9FIRM|nr:hypothetical protein [Candidatus Coproplasma excrementigallinarum]